MNAADIIGYTFQADTFCPSCIIGQLPTSEGQAFDGWAMAAGAAPVSTEDNLAEIAAAFGIDRMDERSFDSSDFPKVIFADMDEYDQCGACHEYLIAAPEGGRGGGGDGDWQAVALHIAAKEEEVGGGEISDACARTIASWYHGGQGTDGYAFVSTGAILSSSSTLYRELTQMGPSGVSLYDTASREGKRALDWLGTYLLNRADRGPVPGWSELWIR